MTSTKEKKILSAEDLSQFIGTTQYWKLSPLYPFLCTDGVHFLAEQGGAFWLLDAIAAWQIEPRVKDDRSLKDIQFWKLIVNDRQSAKLICERDKGDIAITQRIVWTDFPLPEIKLYLCNMWCFWEHVQTGDSRSIHDYAVLMLPSEY
jgi:hypothetical protein